MNPRKLTDRILKAFEADAPPSRDQITPHRCEECDELASDLEGLQPSEVPRERLIYHRWDLPLLSTEAKRYYLPVWMVASIEEPDSDFTDALIMNLDSDHRNDGYSQLQKAVIVDYLRYIRDRGGELDECALHRAEDRWIG